VVVDTPPSRSALDFLDAPKRLGSFHDGRLIRILSTPAKAGGRAYLRVVGAGIGAVTSVMTKVLGAQILRDVQTFVAALDTMFGGFRERAEQTYALLQAPGTAFLVVAAPERDPLREASYFVDRLDAERMPLAGLVVNRLHEPGPLGSLTAEKSTAAAERLAALGGHRLTESLLREHADRLTLAAREQHLVERFTAAYPGVPVADAPAQASDVHDLDGLRQVAAALATP
jgi:anion-transporting  ArsA/GET3 family ATPase